MASSALAHKILWLNGFAWRKTDAKKSGSADASRTRHRDCNLVYHCGSVLFFSLSLLFFLYIFIAICCSVFDSVNSTITQYCAQHKHNDQSWISNEHILSLSIDCFSVFLSLVRTQYTLIRMFTHFTVYTRLQNVVQKLPKNIYKNTHMHSEKYSIWLIRKVDFCWNFSIWKR